MELAGKRVVITGASRGIGAEIARVFASAGSQVVVSARTESAITELAGEIGGVAVPFDANDPNDVRSYIDRVESVAGPIDVLINNAGMQHRTALQDFPPEAFEQLLQTNIASVFHVGQAVARHMIGRKRGKIINIASVQSALARPGIAPYTATKGAVTNLTKGMATDWAKHGLQCNAIAPGYFDTPLNAALVADPEFSAWLTNRTPAGRWGQVEELVGACIFLASDASSFVNGHTLYVDGGITASL